MNALGFGFLFCVVIAVILGPLVLLVMISPVLIKSLPGFLDLKVKNQREQAKLRVDTLRAARLQEDLAVVSARGHLVASQEALVGLRIEEKRRELNLPPDTSFPATPAGTDDPSW